MKESVTGKLRCLALASLCIHLSFLSGIAQSKGIALIPEALQSLQIEWDRYDVYGYSLKHPSFSDYAYKSRYIFLPKNTKAALDLEEGILTFPDETVVVKRFFYASAAKNTRCYTAEGQLDALLLDQRFDEVVAGQECELEVRVLRKVSGEWMPEIYRWNNLVQSFQSSPSGGFQKVSLRDGDAELTFSYSIPDLGECSQCHVGALGRSPGLEIIGPSIIERIDWNDSDYGLLETAMLKADPFGERSMLSDLARDYLDINCAHCHNPAGLAASSSLYLNKNISSLRTLGICKPVVASGVAYEGYRYDIVPGTPEASILLKRMQSVSVNEKMPELGRALQDKFGIKLIADWIGDMSGNCPGDND